MKKYKILSVFIITIVVFAFSFVKIARGLTEGTVNATVTAKNIACSLSNATIAYGTIALSGTQNTTAQGLNVTSPVANNTGNVAENFLIKGTDSAAWTLELTVGANQYVHEVCIGSGGSPDPCDTGGTPVWTKMNADTNTEFAHEVAGAGNQTFDLKISVPSSSASYDEQTVNATVYCEAHT
ncbi:MAG: hypothetical protein ABIJ05_00060 [Patescibacteria group bacterium]